MSPVALLPDALSEMFAQISSTGKLTLADRYGLMAAILSEATTEEELRVMNRLIHALYRNQVQVSNDLSAIV